MANRSARGLPVMKRKCTTCPFGPNGDPFIHEGVVARSVAFEGSQLCHHPLLNGKRETHLCRGARDLQLTLLVAFGALSEPTDEAFAAKSRELGVTK